MTGNEQLDLDHIQVAQHIQDCVEMSCNGESSERLILKLNEIYETLAGHFYNEEIIMDRLGNNRFDLHKKQHSHMLVHLKLQISNFADAEAEISKNTPQEILTNFFEWYETHIEYEDMDLAHQVGKCSAI